ncbi:MAG: RNA polymerase subunit sigma-24 [Alphaproteobacteria bacterium]|nr:RNA polymerase subunit sigma-24 [Alphaproteobacteria bacterium]
MDSLASKSMPAADDTAFFAVMDRLRLGDADAATEVFRKFVRRLVALAARQFPARIHDRADPEDVVQSVFRSFFARQARGQFALEDWEALWALLTVMTVRKCAHRRDYLFAARRDVRRETVRADEIGEVVRAAIDRAPTPAEAAMLADLVRDLLERVGPAHGEILSMTLTGYEVAEIAVRLRRSERTVLRVRRTVRDLLLARLASEA